MNVPSGTAPSGEHRRPAAVRALVAFGVFWWDFLVGDTPEIFVGAVVALGATAGLCAVHGDRTIAAAVFPVVVVAVLGLSLLRAIRRDVTSDGPGGRRDPA